jgi:hypothetical protein
MLYWIMLSAFCLASCAGFVRYDYRHNTPLSVMFAASAIGIVLGPSRAFVIAAHLPNPREVEMGFVASATILSAAILHRTNYLANDTHPRMLWLALWFNALVMTAMGAARFSVL